MPRLHIGLALVVVGTFWLAPADARAQQTTISTPFRGATEGFHERIGTSWSARGRNWSFRFGGADAAVPQFGGYDPNAAARFGFGFRGGPVDVDFAATLSQGNTRTMTSQTPSVTVMNGQQGFISDTSQSPFVIGFIPVVGGFPGAGFLNPLAPMTRPAQVAPTITRQYMEALRRARAARHQEVAENFRNDRIAQPAAAAGNAGPAWNVVPKKAGDRDAARELNRVAHAALDDPAARKLAASQRSSAGRAVMSVAEARQAHAAQQAAQRNDAQVWLERARGAEEAGKANVAAIYYRMAAGRDSGEVRQQALQRLAELKASQDGQR